jgi:hypothetical protein
MRLFARITFVLGALISGGTLIVMLYYIWINGLKRPKISESREDNCCLGCLTASFGCILVVLGPAIWIVELVTVEQTIARNGLLQQANQWTFGQTLSVLMVLAPAIQLVLSEALKRVLAAASPLQLVTKRWLLNRTRESSPPAGVA